VSTVQGPGKKKENAVLRFRGDRGKPKTTELSPCAPALSEGALFQELGQGDPGNFQLGQTKDQSGPLEMQEGHLRPGLEPQREKLSEKTSPEHDGLGTADGICSQIAQELIHSGGAAHDHDSCGSGKDPMIQEEENTFKCNECGKTFNKKHLLAGHEKIP